MAYKATAIAVSAAKEAALYFDAVIPLHTFSDLFESLSDVPPGTPFREAMMQAHGPFADFVVGLLPSELRDSAEFAEAWTGVEAVTAALFFKPLMDAHGVSFSHLAYLTENERGDLWGTLQQRFTAAAARFQLRDLPVITAPDVVGAPKLGGEDVRITLAGLNLIDTRKATWQQIAAFRQDRTSVADLRRLRLFTSENYSNKDLSFIEDDLLSRIETYQRRARQWGFETTHAALEMLLSSKTVVGGLGAGFLSALVGSPSLGAVAAASGVALEIGQIAVEISRRRLELRAALQDSPVSYIVRARSKLS